MKASTSAPAAMRQNRILGVDTHAHVFMRGLKLLDARRYTPDYDVTVEDFLCRLDDNGLSHGVLVQPSFLGSDNSFLLSALQAYPQRLRGIVMVEPNIDHDDLLRMAEVGVVGIRLNLVGGAPLPNFSKQPWINLLHRLADLNWQVELHREACDLPALIAPLLDAGVRVVVDHFGRPDPASGINDAGFQYLMDVARTRRVWVKLSGSYRNGGAEAGEHIALDALPLLLDAFGPDRLLWGSDWPHTQFEADVVYQHAWTQLRRLLPDQDDRLQVLITTPAELFQFD